MFNNMWNTAYNTASDAWGNTSGALDKGIDAMKKKLNPYNQYTEANQALQGSNIQHKGFGTRFGGFGTEGSYDKYFQPDPDNPLTKGLSTKHEFDKHGALTKTIVENEMATQSEGGGGITKADMEAAADAMANEAYDESEGFKFDKLAAIGNALSKVKGKKAPQHQATRGGSYRPREKSRQEKLIERTFEEMYFNPKYEDTTGRGHR